MASRRRRPVADEPLPADEEPAADLLVRFREGDRAAFREIVGTFEPRLLQFFYRLCWDRDRAEDFTQDLFVKLMRGSRSYRPEGKLSTYVFRIATNLWIDHYRSLRPQPRLYSLDTALMADARGPRQTREEGPEERVVLDEEKQRLRESLDALTEPHRLVFELAVYQEMPYPEVSRVLGIPVGTVKSRMHNAVKALRKVLTEGEDAEDGPFRSLGGAG